MDEWKRKMFEDIVANKFPNLLQMLEQNMDFKRWGFRQVFSGISEKFSPSIIYDSDQCRVRFVWYEPDISETATVHIYYGRLHAQTNQRIIDWNGRQCSCWHDPLMAFHFLDGLSPQEAVNNRYKWSPALEKVNQSLLFKGISTPEWAIKMHSASWNHYGERLFNLFDMRHLELWDQYVLFLMNCYKIDPFSGESGLPGYEVC